MLAQNISTVRTNELANTLKDPSRTAFSSAWTIVLVANGYNRTTMNDMKLPRNSQNNFVVSVVYILCRNIGRTPSPEHHRTGLTKR